MSNRDVILYIQDILDSIDAIETYIENMSYETFCEDRKTYSATIREFIVIGEAISKLMDILEENFPDYPWRLLKDFRNFVVHEYFGVNPQIVFDAATQELTLLKKHISNLHEKVSSK